MGAYYKSDLIHKIMDCDLTSFQVSHDLNRVDIVFASPYSGQLDKYTISEIMFMRCHRTINDDLPLFVGECEIRCVVGENIKKMLGYLLIALRPELIFH